MRKIYSILLIACSMLISANIQAKTWEVSTWNTGANDNQLVYAWTNASNGDVIKLTDDITMGYTLFLGSKTVMEAYTAATLSITLDINGHLLQGPAGTNTSSSKRWVDNKAFTIAQGELIVKNSVPGTGSITADEANTSDGDLFFVLGSTKKGCKPQLEPADEGYVPYFSHLVIEKGVVINNTKSNCISIDVADKLYLGDGCYDCNIKSGGGSGVAYGARIDVYGEVNAFKYAVKINGDVRAPQEFVKNSWSLNSSATYPEDMPYSSYNVVRSDSAYVPFVFVHKGAKLTADATNKKSTAIYSSGYGRWQIEGDCEGNTGVYIKAGILTLKDATIKSTNTEGDYNRPIAQHTTTSGIEAGGSAIVVESNVSYSGFTDVTITGDTYVEGGKGYAIDEIVTDPDGTKVEVVKVEGGTIQSGGQGAIILDKKTQGDEERKVTIVGGATQQQVEISDNSTNPPTVVTAQVEDLVPPEGYTSTTIVTPEKTVVVVTPTTGGMAQGNSVAAAEEDKYFVWTGTEETLVADKTMSALEINNDVTQVLTIGDATHKVTYTVGRVILGLGAKIIVNPGSKLIVNGAQGLVAEDPSCVLLRANASEQATFVISPEVTSNKQPKASVEYYTEAYGMPKTGTSSNYKWDRLTTPLSVYKKVSSNYSTLDPQPALLPGQSGLWTFVEYYDELNSEWVGLNAYSEMQAFTCYALSNNTANGGITYTFEGNLQGNVADNIELDHAGWNYMGNAFIAPIHVKTMLTAIANSGAGIDNSMYLWDMGNQKYIPVNKTQYSYFSAGPKEIPALQTFILKLTSGNSALLDLNYAQSVYNYVINPTAANYSAPQRAIASDVNAFRMNIKSANGEEDDVYMVESGEFSADYDNGADIVKYMNKGINFYAEGEEKYAMVASDNIIGSIFSLQTTEAINYTLTFAEVRGEEYALRDNMTGKTIAIVEGAIYNFSAQPNEVAENRFEIVNRDAVTTDINTIVGDNASKAVYTVLGQYVGETADWNNLPAGIYVVDGVKVVK